MGNVSSNVEKTRQNLVTVYKTIHPSFNKEQIENFKKTLSGGGEESDKLLESDRLLESDAFKNATESMELSIYGKISEGNIDVRSEKMLELLWMQNELAELYSKTMGNLLEKDPFTCDNSHLITVHHPSHGFSSSHRNSVIFQGANHINFKNINNKPYKVMITNNDYYSITVDSSMTQKGKYGGEYVTCCSEEKILSYKNSLSSIAKIERSLCDFEKQIFGHLNLCYPDLKGRIVVLKKKLLKKTV